MAYTPAPNEYTVSGSVMAGFPSTPIGFVRINVELQPGMTGDITSQFLDVSGSLIPNTTLRSNYDISGLTSFNNTLKSLVTTAAAGKGLTIL